MLKRTPRVLISGIYEIKPCFLNYVLDVAWSPDGQRIVSGHKDGILMIWDAYTGKQIGETLRCINEVEASFPNGVDPHRITDNWVTSVAWSPDSQKIVSGSFDEMLRIWDAHTGKQIGDPLISHIGRVYVEWIPSLNPTGVRERSLRSRGNNSVVGTKSCPAFQASQSELRRSGNNEIVETQSCPDGRIIAYGDRRKQIWDAQTGKSIGCYLSDPYHKFYTNVTASPDGKRCVSNEYHGGLFILNL